MFTQQTTLLPEGVHQIQQAGVGAGFFSCFGLRASLQGCTGQQAALSGRADELFEGRGGQGSNTKGRGVRWRRAGRAAPPPQAPQPLQGGSRQGVGVDGVEVLLARFRQVGQQVVQGALAGDDGLRGRGGGRRGHEGVSAERRGNRSNGSFKAAAPRCQARPHCCTTPTHSRILAQPQPPAPHLDEEAQHGHHGEAPVLDLLHLQLGQGVGVVGQAEGVKGAAGVQSVGALGKPAGALAVGAAGREGRGGWGQGGKGGGSRRAARKQWVGGAGGKSGRCRGGSCGGFFREMHAAAREQVWLAVTQAGAAAAAAAAAVQALTGRSPRRPSAAPGRPGWRRWTGRAPGRGCLQGGG